MEVHLLPKRPISWFIWIGLIVICLPRYYSSFPFPQLIYQYESEMWTRPTEVPHDDNKWSVVVRSPKTIADFTDVPMSVLVRNKQSSPASAQISAILKCRDGDNVCTDNVAYARALVRGSAQSSVSLENIPANGEVITWFDLRVVVQADSRATPMPEIDLETNIQINQKSVFSGNEVFLSRFDRNQVFRLWVIENLLSPPGSNIVVPIFFLFIVVLAEIVTELVVLFRNANSREEIFEMYGLIPKQGKKSEQCLIAYRWLIILPFLLAIGYVLRALCTSTPSPVLGPFFSSDPLNQGLRHIVFVFIMAAVVVGAMFGAIVSTRRQQTSDK